MFTETHRRIRRAAGWIVVSAIIAAGPASSAGAVEAVETAGAGGASNTASPADASAGTFKVTIGGQKVLLPSIMVDKTQLISLKGMSAALGGKLTEGKRPGDLTVELSGHKLVFSHDQPSIVMVDAAATSLSTEARPVARDLYVPADFITRAIVPLLDKPPATGPAVTLQMIGGEGTLSLVLECPREVTYTLDESATGLVLRLDDRVLQGPYRTRSIESAILKSISFESGPAGLLMRLEKGHEFGKVDVVDLRNPFRIAVELRRATAPATVGAGSGAAGAGADPAVHAKGARSGLTTIVIDPGHGGEQKGAEVPGGLLEKDVTLDLARRLQALLEAAGLRVVRTRVADEDIGLVERATVANRERADLFVSIHVNSAPHRDAKGAETYYLAYQAADREAGELAQSENAGGVAAVVPATESAPVRGLVDFPAAGAAPATAPAGGAGGGVDLVLWDLAQAEHLRESSEFAEVVQGELNKELGLENRGVKQAPFRVLMGAAMPAVLVEVGFITNPAEQAALKSGEYRDRLAGALARAVLSFKDTFDRKQGAARP